MRKLTVLCIVAFAVAVALPAFAATQNVKVSGDITVRGLTHSNYDLDDNNMQVQGAVSASSEDEQWIEQAVGLNVEADLTDNVSTYIRLINQREWDDPVAGSYDNNAFDIGVDEAYITLKEMLYAPLTLKIGRQNLWFGKGFVVGAKLQDTEGQLIAKEYTEVTSFDAIRATLDYDPWTVDLVYSKIRDNVTDGVAMTQGDVAENDIDLYGVNIGYKFAQYNGEAEGYWFWRKDRTLSHPVAHGATDWIETDNIHTIGGRGSFEPIANMSLFGELAYQFGSYGNTVQKRDRSAWAADIGGDYTFVQWTWQPRLGAEYIYYSGERAANTTGDYEGWNPMYRGKFDTAIREFQNVFYATEFDASSGTTGSNNGTTNQHQVLVRGGLKPLKDLDIGAQYAHFWHDADVIATRSDDIGDEIDVKATYDYTEDVQFSLLGAWFIPGNYYLSGQDDVAADIVGSVKVVF